MPTEASFMHDHSPPRVHQVAESPLNRFGERLVDVLDDIVCRFEPDAEPDEIICDACQHLLLRSELGVRRARRMNRQRLRVPYVRKVRQQLEPLYELPASLPSTFDTEPEDAAVQAPVMVPPSSLMLWVRFEPRV